MPELREYQARAFARVKDAVRRGVRRVMLQMPTAAGKTRLATEIVNGAREKQKRVLFTVPTISLIDQTIEAFASEGIRDVGVIQANHHLTDWKKPIQICSVQTLQKRQLPNADLVIRDEAHKLFKLDVAWMGLPTWQATPFIGLSATPWTRGLGRYYQELIVGATTKQLIEEGWLSSFRVFAPTHPDLSGVTIVANDYHEQQLAAVMSNTKLVADAIETWQRLGEQRPTICFAVDCNHARALQERFKDEGVPAAYMDAHTPLRERAQIRRDFESGAAKVVCNVDVMGIGVDWPGIACVSYCRPTRSEMRYVQNIGRGLRMHPGKSDLLILDHSDTTLRLGFVSDIHHESLNGGKERLLEAREKPLPVECKQCHMLRPRGKKCPNCGAAPEMREARPIPHAEGELVEYTALPKYKGNKREFSAEEKRQFMAELLGYCVEKRYNPYWAHHAYKFKFGCGPNGYSNEKPITPSAAMRSWISAYWLRQRKAREKVQQWEAEHGAKR